MIDAAGRHATAIPRRRGEVERSLPPVDGRLAFSGPGILGVKPDDALVSMARSGHPQAFDEIVRRYRSPLIAYAARMVGPVRADDVVQQALLNAYGALTSRPERAMTLRPWLYRIVHNTALNEIRDRGMEHEPLHDSLDGVEQPPQAVERREQLAELVSRMRALPDAQRTALVKHELEGMSHDDIASTLEVTSGAVRQLIYRARTALRNAAALIPLPFLRHPGGAGLDAAAHGLAAGGAAGSGLAVGKLVNLAGAFTAAAVIAASSGSGGAEEPGGSPESPDTGIAAPASAPSSRPTEFASRAASGRVAPRSARRESDPGHAPTRRRRELGRKPAAGVEPPAASAPATAPSSSPGAPESTSAEHMSADSSGRSKVDRGRTERSSARSHTKRDRGPKRAPARKTKDSADPKPTNPRGDGAPSGGKPAPPALGEAHPRDMHGRGGTPQNSSSAKEPFHASSGRGGLKK